MGDIMRPIPFEELLSRVFGEMRASHSIFNISADLFYKDKGKHSIKVFHQDCSTPLGPAAGPHTQLAQNIITSYLVGARFMELKTVQIMDHLEIAKPCIDARDEGHNTEWSTEYTLPKARDEYYKAWIVCHLLEALLNGGKFEKPSFIFNMSVGYNLDGIKQPPMQAFIDGMMNASKDEKFRAYIKMLDEVLEDGQLFEGTGFEKAAAKCKGLGKKISAEICKSVTISTMHGCPPKEIEAICSYMLTEKKIDTFVKLNPTLLGYDEARKILDATGFTHVALTHENFEHDLQWPDAVAMLHRLVELAKSLRRGFGVKLTNTLGNINNGGVLPGDERYMSGRALMPLSITVAAKVSAEFDGKLPISYSGGANAFNIQDIFDTGIRPITVATDMLHPGGYVKMKQLVEILEKKSKTWDRTDIDAAAVKKLSEKAITADYQQKAFRGFDKAKVKTSLPLTDCYVAPCQMACPIHQEIPDYVQLVGEGKYEEALAVIYQDNALPNITCNICDHQCQYHCTRMDYEGAVHIRDMKKIAVEKGTEGYVKHFLNLNDEGPGIRKAAIVGAGPAGLAAAYFLARAGLDVEVLERESCAGGVVRNVIPEFRIAEEAINADVKLIKQYGAKFRFSVKPEEVRADVLKKKYDYILYAVGAEKNNELKVEGDKSKVIEALAFLENYRKNPALAKLGKHVVVVGGGNSAMDAARAAKRVTGVEDVTVIYRRTDKEMPAAKEEVELAMKEGIVFRFLANPVSIGNGQLKLVRMELGEPDASGRRSPVATSETFDIPCDIALGAIGEKADSEAIAGFGVPCDEKGRPAVNEDYKTKVEGVYAIGDMSSGPSTVVRCIASARAACDNIISEIIEEMYKDDGTEHECGCCGHEGHECHCDDGCECGDCEEFDDEIVDEKELEELEKEENEYFALLRKKKSEILFSKYFGDKDFAETEAKRCLECSYYCNKCVDVCPNRANVIIDMRDAGVTDNPFQVVHIDAYCNECGNCATFCPWDGKPYTDKFTVFSRKDDFDNSKNSGFLPSAGEEILVRENGKVVSCRMDKDGLVEGDISEVLKEMIEQIYLNYAYLLGPVED